MIKNQLLEAKYEAQRRLSEQSGHDLRKYPEIYNRTIQKLEEQYGRKFQYSEKTSDYKSSPSEYS